MIQVEEKGFRSSEAAVWEVDATAGLILSPDTCLTCDSVAGTPAQALQVGDLYGFFINANVIGSRGYRSCRYMAYFRLKPGPPGSQVEQAEGDRRTSAGRWDICQQDSAS